VPISARGHYAGNVLRLLLRLVIAVSVIVSVLLLTLVVAAFNRDYVYLRTKAGGPGWAVHLTRTTLECHAATGWPEDRASLDSEANGGSLMMLCVDPTIDTRSPGFFYEWERGPLHIWYYSPVDGGSATYWKGNARGFYRTGFKRRFGYGHSLRIRLIPALILALCPLALWPLSRVMRRRRRRQALDAGTCPNCHYDLRATRDLCPECGAVPGN
jgi:hypothetical protein